MRRDIKENLLCIIVEKKNLAGSRRIVRALLLQHLDHHVVGRLVNDRDHDVLTVDSEFSVRTLLHGLLGNLEHEIPGYHIRKLIAHLFNKCLIDVAGLRRPHIWKCIIVISDLALVKIFRDDLVDLRRVEQDLTSAETVLFVDEQLVHCYDRIVAGHVSRDVVRIRDADVGRRVRRDVGDNIVVNLSVVRVESHIDLDIRIQSLKIGNRFLIDSRLRLICIILRPESDLVLCRRVKCLRHHELKPLL